MAATLPYCMETAIAPTGPDLNLKTDDPNSGTTSTAPSRLFPAPWLPTQARGRWWEDRVISAQGLRCGMPCPSTNSSQNALGTGTLRSVPQRRVLGSYHFQPRYWHLKTPAENTPTQH